MRSFQRASGFERRTWRANAAYRSKREERVDPGEKGKDPDHNQLLLKNKTKMRVQNKQHSGKYGFRKMDC